jgi:Tfp pilus assembly protein PilW
VVEVVLSEGGSLVELLDDELVGGIVVLVVVVVVVAVVVVRLARATVVDGSVAVEVELARRTRRLLTGAARLAGGATVTVACELRWRAVTVVVVARGSASARWRGLVTNPTRLPPTAPMRTAAIRELHRRDSTNRIGLMTGPPPGQVP